MPKKRGVLNQRDDFFSRHKLWLAVATLTGTIVGAGILGIPYAVAKVGFIYGVLIILLLGGAFIALNLFAGEVVLRTKQQHQLTGYAEKYLGKTGKRIMLYSMIFSIYGALTAYLIGEGATLHSLVGWGHPLLFSLLFFAVGFFIVWKGIKAAGRMELILILSLLLIVIIIGVFSYRNFQGQYLTTRNLAYFMLPYGVILFAMLGSPAMPEMQEVLGKEKAKMKKAILIGTLIPIVLYLVFTVIITSLVSLDQFESLEPNKRIATIALQAFSHPALGILANLMAVFSMFTSFITLGLALVEAYELDYGFPRKSALLLTFSIPLVLTLFNLTTFMTVLAVTGSIAGGLDGILITLMYWKAKRLGDRKPEYVLGMHRVLGTALILILGAGLVYQVWVNLV